MAGGHALMTDPAMLDRACLLVEALVFASPEPVKPAAIAELLTTQSIPVPVEEALEAVRSRYADHAVEMVLVAGGWQFRTRPEFASALTKVVEKPRRLSRGAMETLAIIAYHQPCTRAEIEAIRGVSLGQAVLDALLEDSLIAPKAVRKFQDVRFCGAPRPVFWKVSVCRICGAALPGRLPAGPRAHGSRRRCFCRRRNGADRLGRMHV